jgi:hypothetical protein
LSGSYQPEADPGSFERLTIFAATIFGRNPFGFIRGPISITLHYSISYYILS